MTDNYTPVEVFYAYAPEDEQWVQELEKHLSLLQRQQLITTWHPRLIQAGEDWQHVIDVHLQNASIILLLISPDFLASDYCYGAEMNRSLEREQTKGVRVIPILLRPVDWQNAPFAYLHPLPSDATFLTEWKNIDRAFADITAGIRRTLEDLSLLALNLPQADFPSIWNVPFARNPFFLGREDLLTRLHVQLQTQQTSALSQTQAISGLGGIGKTQLAVEYAYRFRQEYQAVFWVHAESTETLNASYTEMAQLLNLSEKSAAKQEVIVQAVKTWLQTHQGWLLILDNADEPDQCVPFLPRVVSGHLLLTTRAMALRRLGVVSPIAVETFAPELGALLLLRRAGLLPPDATLEQAVQQDQTLALQITQELGGLPLALDQAGAYLEATGMSLVSYLQIYQQHRADLLQERRGQEHDHPEPVATTWSLSFQRVEERNAAAAELLRLCAFLAPDAISEDLLIRGGNLLGPLLSPLATDRYLLEKALEALRAYSLVARDSQRKTLAIHRLVQTVIRDSLLPEIQYEWMQRVVGLISSAFPPAGEIANWPECEQLLPHVLLCSNWIEQVPIISPEAAHLLDETGYYLNLRARYAEVEPLFQQALVIREQVLGPEHSDTTQTLNNLSWLYRKQGKYKEAESLARRALAITERVMGPDHPDTAWSLNNLALLYSTHDQYREAEPLYKRVLSIHERVLGPEHPDTARTLNALAFLYRYQKNYTEAEPLAERALTIRERVLGSEHPDTAQSLTNLAGIYRDQDKCAEAEPLVKRALAIREQVLGPEHPDTSNSLNNLALLYDKQGKYEEAELLYQRALAIRERALGPEHPATKAIRVNYASHAKRMKHDTDI
jgi:tetratricopeptide (TPR) repeat protein